MHLQTRFGNEFIFLPVFIVFSLILSETSLKET